MAKQDTPFKPREFSPREFERWLKQGKIGAKFADPKCKNLTARLLQGHIVLNWVGRVPGHGQPVTIKLATWHNEPKDAALELYLHNFAHVGSGDLDVGKFPPFLNIQEARHLAYTLTLIARKRDPRGASKAEVVEGRLTVRAAIDRYEREHQRFKRRGQDVIRNLEKHLEKHMRVPVEEVTRDNLTVLIEPYKVAGQWSRAYRLRADLSAFFRWVEEEVRPVPHYRSPADRIRMQKPPPKRKHTPTLEDCRAIYQAAGSLTGFGKRPAPRKTVLVRLLLLTGCRLSEISGLKWAEINGEKIIIPAERHKTGDHTQEEKVVPLTATMRALLASVPRSGPLVFGAIGGFTRLMQDVRKLSGTSGWVFHDFRRALRSHLRAAGVDRDVCERILGHVVGGAEGSYDFADLSGPMREALELWEQMVGGNVVVAMPRRSA